MSAQHKSMFFDVIFGQPLDIYDGNQVMANALTLQSNLTGAQLDRAQERCEFELENVRRAMQGKPVTKITQRGIGFAVPFNDLSPEQLDHNLQVAHIVKWLTMDQLKQCEGDLLFHLETVKVAKLLSGREVTVIEMGQAE